MQQYKIGMSDNNEQGLIPLQQFTPAFARLERQLFETSGEGTPYIQDLAFDQRATGCMDYSQSAPQPIPLFSSLVDAWTSMHRRFHLLIYWVGGVHRDWFNHLGDVHKDCHSHREHDNVLEQRCQELRRDFELWSLGLEDLKKRLKTLSGRDGAICALLQCHALLAETILGTVSQPRGTLWDSFRAQFDQMVELCRTFLKQEMLDSEASNGSPAAPIVVQRYVPHAEQDAPKPIEDARCPLTFDLSVSMLLVHVISKCRDARVRLSAVTLLDEYPRQEGLWDSSIIANLGRIMDRVERQGASLEEAAARGALAEEIPLSQRVVGFGGRPRMHERKADLILFKANEIDGPTFVTIDW